MRPVRVPIPATGDGGVSQVVPLDIYQKGPVTIAVIVDGVVVIDVEYTLDDVYAADFDSATANWFPAADLQNIAADASAELADAANTNPVMATGLRATNSGAGTGILQIVQAGVMG